MTLRATKCATFPWELKPIDRVIEYLRTVGEACIEAHGRLVSPRQAHHRPKAHLLLLRRSRLQSRQACFHIAHLHIQRGHAARVITLVHCRAGDGRK